MITVNVFHLGSVEHATAGTLGQGGYAHWLYLRQSPADFERVGIVVRSPAEARMIEDAARACREALEAEATQPAPSVEAAE